MWKSREFHFNSASAEYSVTGDSHLIYNDNDKCARLVTGEIYIVVSMSELQQLLSNKCLVCKLYMNKTH